MIRMAFEKGGRIGRVMILLRGVIHRRTIRRDPRRGSHAPDSRRLILLLVVSVLASLSVAASVSAATSFTNPTLIKIPGSGSSGSASPYPSEIVVGGTTGPITDVTVTLHRFGHTFPDDVDVLLVSPSGRGVVLMSGSCGSDDIEDFTWTFTDAAPRQMSTDSSDCGEFTYRPTDHFFGDPWGPPAPPGPYTASLASFDDEVANGVWKLYVNDHGGDDSGDIELGWSLSIQTGLVDVIVPANGTSGTASTSGPASPYPATRTFATSPDRVVSDVNVTIDGIWHENPEDLDLLLVGPQGEKVVLMSGACGPASVSAYGWVWDDEAGAPMPEFPGAGGCSARFHRPSGYEHDVLPAPAPTRGPFRPSTVPTPTASGACT